MSSLVEKYRDFYGDIFVSPAIVVISGAEIEFELLVIGYGAKNGMIIEPNWDKLQPHQDQLVELGYGFSCMGLDENVAGFQEVLNDWSSQDA